MRLPVISIIFLFLFSFLIDFYIAWAVKVSFKNKKVILGYFLSSIAFWIFLIVIICLPRRSETSGLSGVMWMLFSYMSIYAGKFSFVIIDFLSRVIRRLINYKGRQHPGTWTALFFGLSITALMWIGVGFTRHHIVIEEVTLSSPKLPPSFNNYRIVQISDIHVGTWGNDTTFISKLVDDVNSLNPDLIVFTGDIVNRRTEELQPFKEVLARLKSDDGVYSVLGNHDYGDYIDWETPDKRTENNRLLCQWQKEMGWRMLNNESEFIKKNNDSILLIGVENWGDPPFPVYGDLDKAISSSKDSVINQKDSHYKILLSHNPEHWNREVSEKTNIDLTLAGHTHAMQTSVKIGNFKWSPAKYRYEQWGGLYKKENEDGEVTNLYVNTGAGEVGMPARFLGAFPEITLFILKSESNE